MNNMTKFLAPEPVTAQQFIDGAIRTFEFDGEVAPEDTHEATLLADLAAAGIVTVVEDEPKPRPRKTDKPAEEQI